MEAPSGIFPGWKRLRLVQTLNTWNGGDPPLLHISFEHNTVRSWCEKTAHSCLMVISYNIPATGDLWMTITPCSSRGWCHNDAMMMSWWCVEPLLSPDHQQDPDCASLPQTDWRLPMKDQMALKQVCEEEAATFLHLISSYFSTIVTEVVLIQENNPMNNAGYISKNILMHMLQI